MKGRGGKEAKEILAQMRVFNELLKEEFPVRRLEARAWAWLISPLPGQHWYPNKIDYLIESMTPKLDSWSIQLIIYLYDN